MAGPIVPPPVYVLAAAGVQRLLARRPSDGVPRKIIAGALAAAGLGAFVAVDLMFRRHRTTIDPVHPDQASRLVTDGLNAVTRNPIYLGMAVVLGAHALFLGRWSALLPVAGFVAVIDRSQIPAEEAALQKLFGAEYAEYRQRVPRWLVL